MGTQMKASLAPRPTTTHDAVHTTDVTANANDIPSVDRDRMTLRTAARGLANIATLMDEQMKPSAVMSPGITPTANPTAPINTPPSAIKPFTLVSLDMFGRFLMIARKVRAKPRTLVTEMGVELAREP